MGWKIKDTSNLSAENAPMLQGLELESGEGDRVLLVRDEASGQMCLTPLPSNSDDDSLTFDEEEDDGDPEYEDEGDDAEYGEDDDDDDDDDDDSEERDIGFGLVVALVALDTEDEGGKTHRLTLSNESMSGPVLSIHVTEAQADHYLDTADGQMELVRAFGTQMASGKYSLQDQSKQHRAFVEGVVALWSAVD